MFSNAASLPEAAVMDGGIRYPSKEEGKRRVRFSKGASRYLSVFLLGLAVIFFALHFFHLSADFPNFSRWMDWSKYTDEGWYGDGAIRHFQNGHWYVAGDFNAAVALPVWPIVEGLLFHFTGVSLDAARALTVCVFGGILLCSWLLIVRSGGSDRVLRAQRRWVASMAVLLLAANPFCYVFTRLAILEPMLVLLMLAALLCAQSAKVCADTSRVASLTGVILAVKKNALVIVALGLLLPAIVLTKTTGLFLGPALAFMLFASLGYQWRAFLRVGVPAAFLGLSIWLAYFLFWVRPHYLLDYRYLFSANAYTGMTRLNCFSVIWYTVHGVAWIGRPLAIAVLCVTILSIVEVRRWQTAPMVPALLLWAVGYGAFLAYHNNLQPRYYLVIAVPLTLLVPIVLRDLILPRLESAKSVRLGMIVSVIGFSIILVPDALATLAIIRHPQYTFVRAARQINDAIAADRRRDPSHSSLVLSISGSDLSLMTGLRSICDDFGTSELEDRVRQYRPGWYVAWNLIEDDKMDALRHSFYVERVATFPAMDDQDRNVLILYRLDAGGTTEGGQHRRLSGRRFHTKVGQQPSTAQLKH